MSTERLEAEDLWATTIKESAKASPPSLMDRFVVPPFTLLDTRQGYWRDRRSAWLATGIQSELGRGEDGVTTTNGRKSGHPFSLGMDHFGKGAAARHLLAGAEEFDIARRRLQADVRSNVTGAVALPEWADNGTANMTPGTSIFDPVLCELAYRWFAPEGGSVLDPFAGGSVRGIVAAMLGHAYVGIDLSEKQIAANREQAKRIVPPARPMPTWRVGDSARLMRDVPDESADMVLSCPPYFDLEIYSDDPADLSAMSWPDFLIAYETIIEQCARVLRRNAYAVWVIGEVRDKEGIYRGLVPRTVHIFERFGLRFYNEAVLVNPVGTLPIRIARQFEASRKLGRTHQNVLVFVKGTPPRGWSYEREAPPDPQMSMFG
jgi:DNA modification methylase